MMRKEKTMNRSGKAAFYAQILFWVFVSFYCGWTQVTFTSDDVRSTIGGEFFQYIKDDTTGAGMPTQVGISGAAQHWSFQPSEYPGGWTVKTEVVDPDDTPFGDQFSTADFAWNMIYPFGPLRAIQYYNLSPSELLLTGAGVVRADTQFAEVSAKPQRVASFPMTFNTAWSQFFSDTSGADSNGVTFTVINSLLIEDSVDAWGTIDVPLGTFPCLRVRENQTRVFTYYLVGFPFYTYTIRTIYYYWVAENEGPVVTVESMKNPATPDFIKAKRVTFRTRNPAGIEGEAIGLKSFDLCRNYPNPFNPSTAIEYVLPKPCGVRLTITDVVGRHVRTLVDADQTAGRYRISWNGTNGQNQPVPAGVYLCRFEAFQFTKVLRLTLVK
jgi:hypothetical protein